MSQPPPPPRYRHIPSFSSYPWLPLWEFCRKELETQINQLKFISKPIQWPQNQEFSQLKSVFSFTYKEAQGKESQEAATSFVQHKSRSFSPGLQEAALLTHSEVRVVPVPAQSLLLGLKPNVSSSSRG